MNIDWGAGPAFGTEEEWNEWQEKARKICVSHHHACQCREARFAEAMRLLQLMYDMSDKPTTDTDYLMVIGEVGRFLRSMEGNT